MNGSCLSSVTLCYMFWSAFFFPLSDEKESQSLKLNSSLSLQSGGREGKQNDDDAHFLWLTLFSTAYRNKLVLNFI